MKRDETWYVLQDLDAKLYAKEILINTFVDNVLLIYYGRHTNVVTFYFKKMILCMVLDDGLFSPPNLPLSPDVPYSDPLESIYAGGVNTGTWIKM